MKRIKTNKRYGRQSVSRTVCCVFTAIISLQMCHKVYGNGASDGYSSISNVSEEQVMPAEGVQPHSNSTEKVLSGSVFTGNDLWDGIIRDCYAHPSTPCFQKKVHSFLDKVLETRDLNITGRLSFLRNKVRFADVTNVSHGDGHANDFDTEALNESRSGIVD